MRFVFEIPLLGGGRPFRNCPVGNFREEPGCRGEKDKRQKTKDKR